MNHRLFSVAGLLLVLAGVSTPSLGAVSAGEPAARPNIVILVADDLGWGDTGYSGNKVVKTPHLDDMASKGIQFEYFYPGQQMRAPGEFAIMSGRNPCRTGLHSGPPGDVRPEEILLPRALKPAGYESAHFGLWNLGVGKSSPVRMGFDQAHWVSAHGFGLPPKFTPKFQINDTKSTVQTEGDGSIAVMGLALNYIRKYAKKEPFLVQVYFSAPHQPHKAAEEFKALYKDITSAKAEYYGEISGMDTAVGNLRAELRKLGIADNTVVWFTSDNGADRPGTNDPSGVGKWSVGGRVPGLLEWPSRIKQQVKTNVVAGHIDIYPTLLEVAGAKVEKQPVVDGISLVPLIDGKMTERPKPIGFIHWGGGRGAPHLPGKKAGGAGKVVGKDADAAFAKADFLKDMYESVWIDGKYKLIVGGWFNPNAGTPLLYDIYADPAHKTNLADKESERVKKMTQALNEWRRSVRASFDGKDFTKTNKNP